jgi:ubiquinone/menaquinone biosynthesis C-methylase UbiE
MNETKDAARRRFERWAPRYGDDSRSRRNAKPQDAALAALMLRAEDRFLDVGCGTGRAVRKAAAIAAHAVGVDLAARMIERARQLTELPNADFVVGDSESLPFVAGAFTAVLCSSSFHHYPDPGRAINEMARVLAPSGRLAIADPNGDLLTVRIADRILRRLDCGHVHIHRSAELAELAQDAGFVGVKTTQLEARGFLLLRAHRPLATE